MKKKIIGAVLLFAAAASWGGTYVVSKYILATIPIFSLLLGRYIVGYLALWTVCRVRGVPSVKREEWKLVLPGAVIGYFGAMALQFWGTDLCGASMASIISASSTLFVLVIAVFLIKERMTARKVLACLVGFGGVSLVIGLGGSGSTSLFGGIVMLVHSLTWALSTVLFKKSSDHLSTLAITTCALKIAMLLCIPFSIGEMVSHRSFFFNNGTVLLCVLYLGLIASALAFYAWNKGMTMMDAGVGSLFLYFQPVVSALLGWFLLDETLHWSFFVGGVLLVIAVAISISSGKTKELPPCAVPDQETKETI